MTAPNAAKEAKAVEAAEDSTPLVLRVSEGLFLGNAAGAECAPLLAELGVTQTLNLAVNIDMGPLVLDDGTVVRRAKIGLIDGPGNVPAHLVSAVLAIAAMRDQAAPGKPAYPAHRPGGILVHCRGGRSRSVSALALYLSWSEPVSFPDPDDAMAHLRRLRGLPDTQPNAAMCALTRQAWSVLRSVPAG